jgi:hypothetical protein
MLAVVPAGATSVSVSDEISGPTDTDVVVRISVDTDGDSLESLDAAFTFDDNQLELRGVFTTALTDGFGVFHEVIPDAGPDTLDVALFSFTPLPLADGDHEVLWVLFRVLEDTAASSLPLDPTETTLNDDPPDTRIDGSVTATVGEVEFRIPDDSTGLPDDPPGAPYPTVEVPVFADPPDGHLSFDVVVEFNPSVIVVLDESDVTRGAGTADFDFFFVNVATPGQVVISAFDTEPAPSGTDPEIARIRFSVVGALGDATPLDIVTGETDDLVTTHLDDGLFRVCDDADLDGVGDCGGGSPDCDDLDDEVYPGAPQLCDGKNNDCDDPSWPTTPATEVDNDGDDYVECEPWTGDPALSGGDCADADGAVNPGATELCNGLNDENCNGEFSEPEADASCEDGNPCTTGACDVSAACQQSASGTCSFTGQVVYYRDSPPGVDEPSDPAKGVPDVPMTLSGDSSGTSCTDASGSYAFPSVAGDVTATPGPKLEAAHHPAIAAGDAARIAQAVVGMTPPGPLTTRQRIAADVTGNGTISSFDAALVAQYAVGLLAPVDLPGDHFPAADDAASDWVFDPASATHPDVTGSVDSDFVAILFGDVTGNWTTPAPAGCGPVAPPPSAARARTTSELPATARDGLPAVVRAAVRPGSGRTFGLDLLLEGSHGVLAIDLVLDVRALGLRVHDVRAAGIAADRDVFFHRDGDLLRIALVGVEPLEGSGAFLRLSVEGTGGSLGRLSEALEIQANEGRIPVVVSDLSPRPGTENR